MIEVYKHDERAKLPTRANPTDAGLDLYLLEDTFIPIQSTTVLTTGISINIPDGYVGKIEDRSSLASQGLRTGGGVIDTGYNGEVRIVMHNLTNNQAYNSGEYGIMLKAGSKIAQLLIYPVEQFSPCEVTYLWDSIRGSKGFGSSN